ncbi:MAG: glycosyltransferase [Bacteroidetes bacterium]|nr:glycosyltransferase [Bacteroidota bacterium]
MKKIIVELGPCTQDAIPIGTLHFMVSCYVKLIKQRTDIEWLFIVDKSLIYNNILKNIPTENIYFTRKMGKKFWYGYRLPKFCKKNKADLLITTAGIAAVTQTPQCSWMPAILEGADRDKRSYLRFFEKRLSRTLDVSRLVFVCSESQQQKLIQQYHYDAKDILLVRAAPDEWALPQSWAEKESIKVKFAAGKEYFILLVDEWRPKLLEALKAFSLFKKRQQTNMQLVFASRERVVEPAFLVKLESFKYRSDVHVCNNLGDEELARLIAAAYGLVHSFATDESEHAILNAFKSQVPVIAAEDPASKEVAADAALYANGRDIDLLATQMMLLYKDEQLRNQLIEKGDARWKFFDRMNSLDQLYKAMQGAASQSNES